MPFAKLFSAAKSGFGSFFLFAILFSGISIAQQFTSPTALTPSGEQMPLLPYLDYYIDDSLSVDIDEAAAPSRANFYKPLALGSLPRTEGITWLRFTLAPAHTTKNATYLLDMGQSVPGIPLLYEPGRNELSGAMEWRETAPGQRNILLLPEQGPEPQTCYIRLAGLPGPWFAPMLRSPRDAASNLGSLSHNAALLALAIVALLCILRGLSEKGQWRYWTALYVLGALLQAGLGMPAFGANPNAQTIFASLCPGLCLMLLPHVGRHLLNTRANSRNLDRQLLFLSIPGALFALAPLWPGLAWLDRWLDLWPLGIAIFIPTAICAWIMGLAGSRRFLIACLLPPLFTAIAWYGLDFGLPANLLASGPLWGIALSALLLAASHAPLSAPAVKTKRAPQKITSPDIPPLLTDEAIINLDHPLDDPNLRILPQQAAPASFQESPDTAKANIVAQEPAFEAWEGAIREELDKIFRETSNLGNCALPPAAREYAENILSASENLGEILASPGHALPAGEQSAASQEIKFDLQRVLRDAHDHAIAAAEHAGIALSWHMPPHLGQTYQGNAVQLEETLKLLVESAVRGTTHGSVHLSCRRMPESSDPGHILFSVADNGSGYPPLGRSSVAIAKAWETAGNGFFSIEASQQGVTVSFALHLTPVDAEEHAINQAEHVILACDNPDEAEHLAKIMTEIPCRINTAASDKEILICQRLDPASLLVACGKFAKPSAADIVHEFHDLAARAGYDNSYALAITPDKSQWSLLKPSGFTHAMVEPVNSDDFVVTVRNLTRKSAKKSQSKIDSDLESVPVDNLSLDNPQTETGCTEQLNLTGIFEPVQPVAPALKINDFSAADEPPAEPHSETDSIASAGFEGPDWLIASRSAETSSNIENAEKPATVAEADSPLKAYSTPGSMLELDTSVDWVGEPTPIITPASNQESAAKNAETQIAEPENIEKSESISANPQAGIDKGHAEGISQQYSKDPIINSLLVRLEESMQQALEGYENGNSAKVAAATATISKQAESFGLRLLGRMAQCVERAAKANDLAALKDLLPELAMAVERNRIASSQKK